MTSSEKRAVSPGAQIIRVDNVQARSWANVSNATSHVGQIFFATDDATLDDQDQEELQKIVDAYPAKLNVKRVPFTYYGFADYRYTKEHNYDLAQRRAQAVANFIGDRMRLGGYPNYGADVRGLGIDYRSLDLAPKSSILSVYRRVDVFAEPIVPDPKPRQPEPGTPPPRSLQWRARLLGGGGGGFGAAAAEAFRVEIIDLTNKLYMHFWYKGGGVGGGWKKMPKVGGSASSASDFVDFSTSVPIRVQDFEGFARHTGAQLQLSVGGSIDILSPLGPAHCGADGITLKWSGFTLIDPSVGIGALTTIGVLTPTQATPWPW